MNNAAEYMRFIDAVRRDVSGIYAYDSLVNNWPEDKITNLQLGFLQGLKKILLRDIFYRHVVKQIEDGNTLHLPQIYPRELEKNLSCENVTGSLKNLCILMTYRKPYSIAKQIERINLDKDLSGEKCYFYKNLGIGTTASDGNHRVISASMTGYDLKAPITIIDDEPLIRQLTTDGRYWYAQERVGDVPDWEIAVVHTITKAILLRDPTFA